MGLESLPSPTAWVSRRALISGQRRATPGSGLGVYARALFVRGFGGPLGTLIDRGRDVTGLLLDKERLPRECAHEESSGAAAIKQTVDVLPGDGRRVGTLHYDLEGRCENAVFADGAVWPGNGARFAPGPTLRLQAGPQFHRKSEVGSLFHAAMVDTGPDGWARRVIMRKHIKRMQQLRRERKQDEAERLNAPDDLLAAEDRSRVGAFRFRGENGVFQRPKMPDRRTPEQLAELPAGTDKLQQFRALAKAIQTSSSIMITTGAASPVARFWENKEEEKQCAHWFIPHLMR